jgi:hypothetical protein
MSSGSTEGALKQISLPGGKCGNQLDRATAETELLYDI